MQCLHLRASKFLTFGSTKLQLFPVGALIEPLSQQALERATVAVCMYVCKLAKTQEMKIVKKESSVGLLFCILLFRASLHTAYF